MKDQSKTKQALIQELASLRERMTTLEQPESESKRIEDTLQDIEEELASIYENAPIVLLVVDKEWTIRKTNAYTAHFVGRAVGDMINLRCGESLHCIHSLDAPEGCGFGPSCGECTLRLAAINTIETGHGYHEAELSMSLSSGGKKREAIFLLSTARLIIKGQPMALVSMQDITERKRIEEGLRQAEENFRRSLDDSPLGVRIVTIEGETIYINRAILDIYGYDSLEDFRATPVEKRYTPESYAEHLIRKGKRKGGDDVPSEYGISITKKDCEVHHLQVFRKEILWDGEKQFQVLYNDITEHKQTEEALQQSEELHRVTIENILDPVFITDSSGKFTFICPNVPYILGYSRKEIEAMGNIEALLGDPLHLFDLEKLNMEGKITNIEAVIAHKDGIIRDYLLTVKKVSIKSGTILYVCRDITDRKQAEYMLGESEKRYRSLFENSMIGISRAYPDGRLITANNAYAQMYGYANAEEMMAEVSHVGRLYANPEDRKEVLHILKEKGFMEPREIDVVRRDGTRLTVLASARQIKDFQGNMQYYQAEHIDITERKQAEEELRTSRLQLRALATRLQQIREEERIMIAREIHDEMGGGLTGLKMDLSWLLRKMGDADPGEERVALMDKIHTANALIDQMIHVVRRISTDLRPSILDDLGLIAALEWQLSEFTSRTEIPHEFATTFEYVNMEEDTAVAVFRIFQEALTNVVRHARATKVAVVLREGERSLFGDESLVLEIRDNGRGITEEEILNPESLGLLGMKERVLAFGGELSIRGEPGGGTALVLKIPRKQGETS